MHVQVVKGSITHVQADAVVVNLFAGVTEPGGATGALDQALGGMIRRLIQRERFNAALGSCLTFYTDALTEASTLTKVIVVGLGERASFNLESVRLASAAALKAARAANTRRLATIVHGAGIGGLDVEPAAQAVAEGTLLAAYRYAPYKGGEAVETPEENDGHNGPKELIVVEHEATKLARVEAGARRGTLYAESTNWARDLVNTPPNDMTPTHLAQAAQEMAARSALTCEILEIPDMERLGMGSLLAVARGSSAPPKLITLRYRGDGSTRNRLALVGKGVTFDSGGLSLKTSEGMISMKDDMAGAAAVLGAMRIIAQLRPAGEVLAAVPCVENMPSGHAVRPGDVVRACNGKTIEIHNTDAEGRLILADAVAYAHSQGVDEIVDVATLTGAVGVALGEEYTGVIGNDEALIERVIVAGDRCGERYWQLPSPPEYKRRFTSDIADLKNVGGRLGGAIIGGMIIGEFVGGTPWAHLDIAATASRSHARGYLPKGASGVSVRTLAELALISSAQ